ncbi:MAG: hypothetical protein ACK542_11360, partial [Burkholderiales bacterium]
SGCCNDAQHDAAGSGKSGGSLIDDTPYYHFPAIIFTDLPLERQRLSASAATQRMRSEWH